MNGPVSLVIPARNASATLRACLGALAPIRQSGPLREIIVVDDGSTDDTAVIAKDFGAVVIQGQGRGPAAARNLGWRRAESPLVWFIDSDCVAEPDALDRLLPHMADAAIAGAGGSYGIMNPESLLACLIHEEIVARHAAMPQEVAYLATFNVLYRRDVLERLNGFDERFITAEDADFSFRATAAGCAMRFEVRSRVKHFHPTRWRGYLRTQRKHGYWRMWLYRQHRNHAGGDRYSGAIDHIQPPLAALTVGSLPLAFVPNFVWAPLLPAGLLALAQFPMTLRLLHRTRQLRYAAFAGMSYVRAFWRAAGMVHGIIAVLRRRSACRPGPEV